MLHCTKNRKYFARMKELDIDLTTAAKTLAVAQKEQLFIDKSNEQTTEFIQTKFTRV